MYPSVTRQTLLDRIKSGDEGAWNEFYEAYRGLVWLKGRDYNLTETEQQDLLSDVMLAFFNVQGKFLYDPSKGKFRFYFRKLIASCSLKIISKRTPDVPEGTDVEGVPEQESEAEEAEWQAALFRQALNIVKQTMDSRQVQCFMRCKLEGESPVDVADDMGISLATAYNYCNATIKELKVIVRQLNEQYG